MGIELGTRVQTSDGRDAGEVGWLILDPASNAVKAAVIRKGFLLPHDVEVPLSALHTAPDGSVRLIYTADELAALPEFFESNYTTAPPPGFVPPIGYPMAGFYWPAGYEMGMPPAVSDETAGSAQRDEIDAALRRQDVENAVVGEGSTVMSRDGQNVGAVHRLIFDPDSSRLTRFVVRKGLIFTQDTELPAMLIDSVGDGIVSLRVTAQEVNQHALHDAPERAE